MRSGQRSNGDRDEHRSIAGQIGPQLLQPAGHHLGPETWSDYAGFHRAAGSIGGALKRDNGLEAGDRVAITMSNRPEFLETLFGIWYAGLVAVPINAKLHPSEFAVWPARTRPPAKVLRRRINS